MEDIPLNWLFGALAAMIVASAFFSIAETAMMAINRFRLKYLASEGNTSAVRVQEMLKRTDRLLGGILIGNTLAITVATTISGLITVRLFGDDKIAYFVSPIFVGFLIIVFAEITPKVIGGRHFEQVRSYLDAMGQEYIVTPRLVRGLDYYVRTTFEVKTTELGAQDAVAGGGRYDGLVERLGGPADPGIGFAIGLERVVLLLGNEAAGPRPSILLIPLGDRALQQLMPVARAARRAGVIAELGYGARKLPRELERANKLGVAYAVIAGDNELGAGEAVLREMKTGEQRRVPLARLAEELISLGSKGAST